MVMTVSFVVVLFCVVPVAFLVGTREAIALLVVASLIQWLGKV
jgi:hypothetical protein